MTVQYFLTRLAAVTLGTSAALLLLWQFALPARLHSGFMALSVVLFLLVCTGLFFAGKSAAGSSSKLAFNNLVLASVFGKMVLAVAVLLAYQQLYNPTNRWYVGIFLIIYVVYTVFEVWFMTRLAKT